MNIRPLDPSHDDHCRCLNCDYSGLVERGSDTCPGCGMAGALVFVDDNGTQQAEKT